MQERGRGGGREGVWGGRGRVFGPKYVRECGYAIACMPACVIARVIACVPACACEYV